MPHPAWLLVFLADLTVRLGLSVRVIMRRRPVGVTLAWLAIVLVFPLVGAVAYLLFGELRLGQRRARQTALVHARYRERLESLWSHAEVDWSAGASNWEPLSRLVQAAGGIPALAGNALELLPDPQAIFRAMIADIDAAERTCHMEFYIWNVGGTADEVAEALVRAAGRGVKCRVLVDAVGSKAFLASPLAERMRKAGVQIVAALPARPLRVLFYRLDLRLHRKIAVFDGQVAYTGSFNLVDPRYFKQDAHVGEWVDAMVRLRGPAVEGLALTFVEDWEIETGEGLERMDHGGDVRPLEACGPAVVQVLPSGPLSYELTIPAVLLAALYAARRELILTTPYFVPEEPLLLALASAAVRGVEVTLIVPARNDSHLVRLASEAFLGDLMQAGVRVMSFKGGLLHTKSLTVDGRFSLFGSLNLDPRSFYLNFEITLAIFDPQFTTDLRGLQQQYIKASVPMDLAAWEARPLLRRFASNVARLAGPLL